MKVKGKIATDTVGSISNKVTSAVTEEIGGNYSNKTTGTYTVKAGNIILEADTQITLKVGGNFVNINSAGVQINGTMVLINSGGAAGPGMPGTLVPPLDPEEAEIADNADPGSAAPTYKNQRREIPPPKIPTFTKPSHKPKSPKNKDKKSWIEIVLVDDDNKPVPGKRYRITLPDGKTLAEGTTDEKGFARVNNIDPGTCKVTFPDIDKTGWKKR